MKKHVYLHLILRSTLIFWVIASCMAPTSSIPTPVRYFPTEDLLLDASAFPGNWSQETTVQEWSYETVPGSVKENRYIQFKALDAGAIHSIYRFTDGKAAAEGFSYPWLKDADRISSWETPEWIAFNSHLAERFQLACADFEGGYPVTRSKLCIAVGQYGEFISVFSIWMAPPDNLIKGNSVLQQALNEIEKLGESYMPK